MQEIIETYLKKWMKIYQQSVD